MIGLSRVILFAALVVTLGESGSTTLPKCVRIFSINTPLDDINQNFGIRANTNNAFLSDKPQIFRVRSENVLGEKTAVSLESVSDPGYFLRQKNYNFRLEKDSDSSIFSKDATFYMIKITDNPLLYALELSGHPQWFLWHTSTKPYNLKLKEVKKVSKTVLDATFYLSDTSCPDEEASSVVKKTVLVEDGTLVDEDDDEDVQVEENLENLQTETSAEDPDRDIVEEVKEAFNVSTSPGNVTFLEKVAKDLDQRLSHPTAAGTPHPDKESDKSSQTENTDDTDTTDEKSIKIYTETDPPSSGTAPVLKQDHVQVGASTKKSKSGQSSPVLQSVQSSPVHQSRHERVEIVGGPVANKKPAYLPTGTIEFNKEITVKGRPKLDGHVTIEETFSPSGVSAATNKQIKSAAKIMNQKQDETAGMQKLAGKQQQLRKPQQQQQQLLPQQQQQQQQLLLHQQQQQQHQHQHQQQQQHQQQLQQKFAVSNANSAMKQQGNRTLMSNKLLNAKVFTTKPPLGHQAPAILLTTKPPLGHKPEQGRHRQHGMYARFEKANRLVSSTLGKLKYFLKEIGSGLTRNVSTGNASSGAVHRLHNYSNAGGNAGMVHAADTARLLSNNRTDSKVLSKGNGIMNSASVTLQINLAHGPGLHTSPNGTTQVSNPKSHENVTKMAMGVSEVHPQAQEKLVSGQKQNLHIPAQFPGVNKPQGRLAFGQKQNLHIPAQLPGVNKAQGKLAFGQKQNLQIPAQLPGVNKPQGRLAFGQKQNLQIPAQFPGVNKPQGRLAFGQKQNLHIPAQLPGVNKAQGKLAFGQKQNFQIPAQMALKTGVNKPASVQNPTEHSAIPPTAPVNKDQQLAPIVPDLTKLPNSSDATGRTKLLQDTFHQLNYPDESRVFYLDQCKDEFPKQCDHWAKQRYCLTFSELMKRYCRKACKVCNHVQATGFTECDKSCGGGVRLRMLKVNNRQVLQRKACNVQSCPIHGGYSPYSEFSECSVTCGDGVQYRHRSCTNPPPQYGGLDCSHLGNPVETKPCFKKCKEMNAESMHHKARNKSAEDLSSGDSDNYPEYTAEASNPANSGYTVNPIQYGKHKPTVLDHVHGNYYEHTDHQGNQRMYYLEGQHDDQAHNHEVLFQGKPVTNLKCSNSRLMQLDKPDETPEPSDQLTMNARKRSPSRYGLYDEGHIMYDKEGIPVDTDKTVVQAYNSPYKIILKKDKNNKMSVMEDCIESDISVDPEDEMKKEETEYSSAVGPFKTAAPLAQAHTRTSSQLANSGLYEYKYDQAGQSYDEKMGQDLKNDLGKVINAETQQVQKSFTDIAPRPTLREELSAERQEAVQENDLEESLARRRALAYANKLAKSIGLLG